jgi:hypothetical protein
MSLHMEQEPEPNVNRETMLELEGLVNTSNAFEDWIKTMQDRRSEFSSDDGQLVLLGLIWSAAERWKHDLGDKSMQEAMWMIIRKLGYKIVSS